MADYWRFLNSSQKRDKTKDGRSPRFARVGQQNANDIINYAKRNYHTLWNAVTMRSSAPLPSPALYV